MVNLYSVISGNLFNKWSWVFSMTKWASSSQKRSELFRNHFKILCPDHTVFLRHKETMQAWVFIFSKWSRLCGSIFKFCILFICILLMLSFFILTLAEVVFFLSKDWKKKILSLGLLSVFGISHMFLFSFHQMRKILCLCLKHQVIIIEQACRAQRVTELMV